MDPVRLFAVILLVAGFMMVAAGIGRWLGTPRDRGNRSD